jgi:hypothetical protein
VASSTSARSPCHSSTCPSGPSDRVGAHLEIDACQRDALIRAAFASLFTSVLVAMRVVISRRNFLARDEIAETLAVAVAPGQNLPALCHLQKTFFVDCIGGSFCAGSTQRGVFETLALLRCKPMEHETGPAPSAKVQETRWGRLSDLSLKTVANGNNTLIPNDCRSGGRHCSKKILQSLTYSYSADHGKK